MSVGRVVCNLLWGVWRELYARFLFGEGQVRPGAGYECVCACVRVLFNFLF